MPHKIFAVDDGHAYTKVAWMGDTGHIGTSMIPSIAGSGMSLTQCGYTTTDGGFQVIFTVSPPVSNPRVTEFEGYRHSALNRVIVHHALLQTKVAVPGDVLEIGLTVPMGVFYGVESNAMKDRRKASFAEPVYPSHPGENKKSLTFSAIEIYPEAAAAYVDYLLDAKGHPVQGVGGHVAIVDVGGYTTDVAVMLDDMQIDQAQSGTDEIGVLTLLRRINEAVKRKYGYEAFVGLAEKALREPGHRVPISGQIMDLSGIVNEAKHEVAQEIRQLVRHRIGSARGLAAVVFVGDGAMVLNAMLTSYPHVYVPGEPQLANARGMLKYMLYCRS